MFPRKLSIFGINVFVILNFTNNTSGRGLSQDVLVCDKVHKYDPSTHTCENGTVVPVSSPDTFLLTCGYYLQTYDTRTHKCQRGKIVARPDASCWLNEKETGQQLRCCGKFSYDPEFQTCCHTNGRLKYMLHEHKKEKDHVCCALRAYRRGSPKSECHKSALNDRLFKAKKIRIRKVNQKLCKEDSFIYMIEVRSRQKNFSHLKVRVSMWRWNPSKSKRMLRKEPVVEKNMRIRLDKNSPKKDITGKRFLVFTGHRFTGHRYTTGRTLRLRYIDRVYRFQNNEKKQRKLLKRIREKCKQLDIPQS